MSPGPDRRLRVTVTDTWDTVTLSVSPDRTLGDIKGQALGETIGAPTDPLEYVLKFRGAAVLDESRTVGDLALPDNAPMIVLPRRRRPVR